MLHGFEVPNSMIRKYNICLKHYDALRLALRFSLTTTSVCIPLKSEKTVGCLTNLAFVDLCQSSLGFGLA